MTVVRSDEVTHPLSVRTLHELLGVLLEHGVDLVQEIVELFLQLLALLGRRGVFDVSSTRSFGAGFCLRSRSGMATSYVDASRATSSAGVSSTRANNASTWASLPRSGSIIGIRRNGSDADVEDEAVPVGGDDGVGPAGEALAPEVGPGAWRAVRSSRSITSASVDQPLDLARPHQPLVERPLGADVVVLEVEQRELGVVPREAVAVDVRLEQRRAS